MVTNPKLYRVFFIVSQSKVILRCTVNQSSRVIVVFEHITDTCDHVDVFMVKNTKL
jgi:hypothetical protein